MTKPTIHQKINFRMIQLIDYYVITNNPLLSKYMPKNLKGKARYNTCYDFPRQAPPIDMINEYIRVKGEKARTYIKNNMHRNKYLRVDIFPSPTGTINKFSLLKELPKDSDEVERTGSVRFIDVNDLKI